MHEGEVASLARRHYVDRDVRVDRRVFRHEEPEHQALGPIELEVFAGMFDILAVTPIDYQEAAADARIDLHSHYLTRGSRK